MKKSTPNSDQMNKILMLYALILSIFVSSFATAQSSICKSKLKHVSFQQFR
jgi:hypothetical protein